jgi:hypothetical protein
MFRRIFPLLVTAILSVITSVLISTVFIFPRFEKLEIAERTSEMMLRTDEQAAEQRQVSQPPFPNLDGKELAEKALVSICAQLRGEVRCGKLSDYSYYAQRDDGLNDGAVAFWYEPVDRRPNSNADVLTKLMCDFANEGWVICHGSKTSSSGLKAYYARTITDNRNTKLGLRKKIDSRP